MLKFRITNTSKDLPRFIIEAGKLLKPGQSLTVNRVFDATRGEAGLLIEEGEFASASPLAKVLPEKQTYDDDDDDAPVKPKAAEDPGPGKLVDNKKASRIVPLNPDPESTPAVVAAAKAGQSKGEDDDFSARAVDELEGDVAKADKSTLATKGDEAASGFVTRSTSTPAPSSGGSSSGGRGHGGGGKSGTGR